MTDHLQDSETVEDTQKDKYLTFSIGSECYGIEIRHVIEIIGIQPITEIPELPEYVKGIMNLRGQIIPLMDIRLRFRKPFRDYNDRTCVIVVGIRGLVVGLIVDSVSEVVSIPGHEVVPPPDLIRGGNRFVRGIGRAGNEIKLLLDNDKLLYGEEAQGLANML